MHASEKRKDKEKTLTSYFLLQKVENRSDRCSKQCNDDIDYVP